MNTSVLVLPGWACGPELLAPLLPRGARAGTADWDRARSADDLVPLALEAAAGLPVRPGCRLPEFFTHRRGGSCHRPGHQLPAAF